jgi:hypothetical protein
MGMYCCCGIKIRAENKCTCDQTGWHDAYKDQPEKDGTYLTRFMDNGGDKYEKEQKFSVEPIRIDRAYYGNPVPIHWEKSMWDDYFVYQWKEL